MSVLRPRRVFQRGRRAMPRHSAQRLVGGLWDQIGTLQYEFLLAEGLMAQHYLLDVGCGSMRGGVNFVNYLDEGHYFGVDQDERLLAAGRAELEQAGLIDKRPVLEARGDFAFGNLGQRFEFALAQSVFTHLTFNRIVRCVAEVSRVLLPGGRFYATFFENPGPRLRTEPIPVRTDVSFDVQVDDNPYYYDPDLFSWLCQGSDLVCEHRGEWGHPRFQQMLVFTKR